jgi:hypothetical protein
VYAATELAYQAPAPRQGGDHIAGVRYPKVPHLTGVFIIRRLSAKLKYGQMAIANLLIGYRDLQERLGPEGTAAEPQPSSEEPHTYTAIFVCALPRLLATERVSQPASHR